MTEEEFIDRLKIIHKNEYDYSLINYINTHSPITIICKNHGKFIQSGKKSFKR